MRTLLLSFVCLLSACAATESGFPTENLAETGTTAETPPNATAEARRGRRAALWTGIGFALYAIYEANDGDSHDLLPTPTPTLDLGSACGGVKCW